MIKVNNVIKKYSQFVSKYPITIILIVVLITGFTAYYAKNVAIETTSEKDNLPDNYPVIESLNYVEDNFGGYDSVMIAIQLNKELYSVNDITDLRDPSIITYIDKLTKLCNTVENVSEVNSISTLLKSENNDLLPKDKTKINKNLSSIVNNNYISEDYTLAIINIKLTDDYKDRELANDLEQIIDEVPKPNGVTTTIAGKIFEYPIILDAVEPDMSKTSYMSLLGIIIILLFLFRSLIYGMIPLSTIGLGVIWTFGFIGLIGLNLTTMTSGVISMIMGIGIDFGIQMVIRLDLN
jgi:predicted RND superfamily exporter protein